MIRKSILTTTLFTAVAAMLATTTLPTQAAGLLVADGGFGGVLEIKEHDVNVTINNGIAVTEVTQVFLNTENRQVEALYTFPVPEGASVANFSMWIGGKEMIGEVLEKERAREIYQSYKATREDPGLLEQTDFRSFEMRVFPINAKAEQKVKVTYYQELNYYDDWGTYVYPLATSTRPGIDTRATERFAISFNVHSEIPIQALESPSHGGDFVIAAHSDHYYQAELESTGGSLARDVVLAHQIERATTGFDLITSKRRGEDGYFCLTLTAGNELEMQDIGMDYVFVVDISGSMRDDRKLLLSKDSVAAFVDTLGARDRFEVMTFNITPTMAFNQLETVNEENRERAHRFLASAQAAGGTTIKAAIETAYRFADADRQLNVIVLSDGLTDQADRNILLDLIQKRPRNSRVFCVGVGNDVNRPLLEQMAEDSGGLAAFVSQNDNLKRQATAFRRKLTRPAASDLQIKLAGIGAFDVVPNLVPNLYHGAPVRIYGRYSNPGEASVELTGQINGVAMNQVATMTFDQSELSNPEIDRMWAWHKIDGLLKTSNRNGNSDRVIDEIVQLSETYSIVSEYTSFLVLENDAEYQRWRIDRRNTVRLDRDREARLERQRRLDSIRDKAIAGLGPIDPTKPIEIASQQAPRILRQAPVTPSTRPAPPRAQPGLQLGGGGGGSGPVGPLFIGLVALLRFWRRNNLTK
ncbi:MAG: VIT and VWA domain-containing protein [Verrucomicrobiota bacterium]